MTKKSPTTKGKGCAAGHSAPFKNLKINTGKCGTKSTATQSQYARLIKLLRRGDKNTFQLRKAGIMSPATRIMELNRKYGFEIVRTELRDLWDEFGFMHVRVAVYALLSEPGTPHGKWT